MPPRATVTPIALAVLALLQEGPMHPYRMLHELRIRGQMASVRRSAGSIYHAVTTLERRGLVATEGTHRTGRRPEHTAYVSTEHGRQELRRSLAAMLRGAGTDPSTLATALIWIDMLDASEAADALRERVAHLQKALTTATSGDAASAAAAYRAHMLRAERDWLVELVRRLEQRPLRKDSERCHEPDLADLYSSTRVLPWS
ncbi:PadR family transcriptional regulator [Actinoplanes sp. CA-030573]|uniref:PadR family transcriptional regulator n=1 Tax=Actinoplanes sp. CA-030573 TaxID=3239898 RepID=UPI003D8E11D6